MPSARLILAALLTLISASGAHGSPAIPWPLVVAPRVGADWLAGGEIELSEAPPASVDTAEATPVLIGTYGTQDDLRALLRLASGRYVKMTVGDRLDSGRVTVIERDRLIYTKGDLSVTLTFDGD